jgi:hypothetical protein
MKIYLASRYSRREELCGYRSELEAMGHEVTSRWLNGNHQIDDAGLSLEAAAAERTRFAQEDWDDLMAADCCISFTEAPRSSNSRGGRHVEFGAAMAAGKVCVVIGPRENVFHCLPDVWWYPEWAAAFDANGNLAATEAVRSCRVCGCTDDDCSGCVERTGEPCFWVESDLCSACAAGFGPPAELAGAA